MKKITSILMVLTIILSFAGCSSKTADIQELASWNDCESISALKEYVNDVTNEKSQNFIPEEDRIAVFDLDGTLVGEQFPIYFEWMMYAQRVLNDETYTPTKEQIDVAKEIIIAARDKSIPDDLEEKENKYFGEVFDGMSNDDFQQYVENFLQTDVDGFDNLKLCNAYFRPVLEVVNYLKDNNFIIYIVSGTDRDVDRIMLSAFADIPNRQVIGSDYYTVASNQGDDGYLEYQYTSDDEIVRDSKAIIKDVKMSKVVQMSQEIGQQPVLAFGNSSGDQSMFTYTTANNEYASMAFCIIPDDDEREYANEAKAEKLTKTCEENGWQVISTKNDFKTIYGDGVVKNENNTQWLDSMLEKI